MRATTYKIALALACLMQASAAPIPESASLARRQGAGVGAGCNSILSDTDTTIGDFTQSEGENLSNKMKGGARLVRRQGAGVGKQIARFHGTRDYDQAIGAGCNSLFSDSDTTVGDFTQSEGESLANTMKGSSNTGSGNSAPAKNDPAPAPAKPAPAGPKGPKKRQANGIGYGIADVMKAAGAGQAADSFGSEVNSVDGDTTDGSAQLGESIGQSELSIGRSAETMTGAQDSYSHGGAHSTKKRQANGIGYGIADVLKAGGAGDAADNFGSEVNAVDGDTTEGSAEMGQSIGESELSIGRSAETMTGAQDSYSHGGAHST